MAEHGVDRADGARSSSARSRVLEQVTGSSAPLDVDTIADALGLHVTTVRFHLDNLVQVGLVRRTPEEGRHRGRPRLLYSVAAAARREDSRGQLIDVLVTALAEESADDRARSLEAGRRWADELIPTVQASSDDERLLRLLDELGFDPRRDGGDSIELLACPFRDAARRHPEVVCTIHLGLIQRVVGAGPTSAQLLPFVEPERCLVTLHDAG